MEAKKDRPDPYLAGFADGEAGKSNNAAAWVLVSAEWSAYMDGWHVGMASKWGPCVWRNETHVYCRHCGHRALNPPAEQQLKEGYQSVVCGVCHGEFRANVHIRREYSSVPTND